MFTSSKSNKLIKINAIRKASDGTPTINLWREASQKNIELSNFQQETIVSMHSYTSNTLIKEIYIQAAIKDQKVQEIPKTHTKSLLIKHRTL